MMYFMRMKGNIEIGPKCIPSEGNITKGFAVDKTSCVFVFGTQNDYLCTKRSLLLLFLLSSIILMGKLRICKT